MSPSQYRPPCPGQYFAARNQSPARRGHSLLRVGCVRMPLDAEDWAASALTRHEAAFVMGMSNQTASVRFFKGALP